VRFSPRENAPPRPILKTINHYPGAIAQSSRLFTAMKIVIIGSGIVGATIAYELAQNPDHQITVLDRQPHPVQPDQTACPTSTGAALGVLMAAISKKEKGRNLRMRLAGVDWYDRIIPELEAITKRAIPVNRQGILMLQFSDDRLEPWEHLIPLRQTQNRRLEIWDIPKLQQHCPQINLTNIIAGIYSPDDRQINPVTLTQNLITAAQTKGVNFRFSCEITHIHPEPRRGATLAPTPLAPKPIPPHQPTHQITAIITNQGQIACDRLIISAGLGSLELTQTLNAPLPLQPILGQAIHLKTPQPLGQPDFQPVITGHDIHLVPIAPQEYWVGATVEFGTEQPDPQNFQQLMAAAIDLWPGIAPAETLRQWYGLRPRPDGRSAPVIEPLAGYQNVLLATAHYRNGVLLAPATAMAVADWLS
jgi:glycine oxidase